jgi:2-methylcitrate dehydratase
LSLAGAANIALRQTRVGELSHWKACAFANAARNGVFAARLAAAGVTGPEKIFEGEKGFFKLVSGPFRLPPLKRPSMIHKTHIKFFPVEYHAQSAVEAALRLRARTPEAARAVSVAVDTFEAAVDIIGRDREKWRPRSRETADHSLPYCVAAALSDGKMGPAQFSPRRLRDRRLLALVQKVRVREDKALTRDYPAFLPCRLTVRTAGGKTLTEYVRAPRGHAKNPMSDGEVEEKFRRLAGPRLPMKRMEQVVETVWGLERVARMDALMRLLRAS